MTRLALACTAALVALASNSCSLVYDDSADQCATTEECRGRGPAFANSVCGDNHVCSINALISCTTNAQCIDAHQGQPYFCRKADSQCISLKSQHCTTIMADGGDTSAQLRDDNTVFIGFLNTLTYEPNRTATGRPAYNSVDMARNEINSAVNGLPPATPGGPRRPFVLVVCDESVGGQSLPGSVVAAAEYLVKEVRVPVIIGPTHSDYAIKVSTDITTPNNVLLLSYGAVSASLTSTPAVSTADPVGTRLLFRTQYSAVLAAKASALAIANYYEPQLKAAGAAAAGKDLRIANVYRGDTFGKTLSSNIYDNLTYNGKTPVQNADNYLEQDYGVVKDPTSAEGKTQIAQAALTVSNAKPHIIIITGNDEVFFLMGAIEAAWTEPSFRPLYFYTGASSKTLGEQINKKEELRKRNFLFVSGPQNNPRYDRYTIKFKSLWPDETKDGKPYGTTASAYDAMFVTYYALAALGSKPVTGPNLAVALGSLIPAPGRPRIDTTGEKINEGLGSLGSGGIDLDGASGPLDFDLKTGDTPADIALVCIAPFGPNGEFTTNPKTGYYYDGRENKMVGTPNCP